MSETEKNTCDDVKSIRYSVLSELRRVISAHDDETIKRYGLALTNVLQNKFDEAVAELLLLDKSDPDSPLVHNLLGRTYILRKEYRKAISHLQKAVELNPHDYTAMTWLVLMHYRVGNVKEAKAQQSVLEKYAAYLSVNYEGFLQGY